MSWPRSTDGFSNEEKILVRQATNAAIRAGKLKRSAECEDCGSKERIECHHEDYANPLKVRWLCRACHKAHHGLAPTGMVRVAVRMTREHVAEIRSAADRIGLNVPQFIRYASAIASRKVIDPSTGTTRGAK